MFRSNENGTYSAYVNSLNSDDSLAEDRKYRRNMKGRKADDLYASVKKALRDYMDDDEVKIIRTKKFDIKPMYPEDACIQMELLGHNFYVFCNAETDQVNVVYKRKGNTYGLIEPEE